MPLAGHTPIAQPAPAPAPAPADNGQAASPAFDFSSLPVEVQQQLLAQFNAQQAAPAAPQPAAPPAAPAAPAVVAPPLPT
jgi:translation initiation factor IF-2